METLMTILREVRDPRDFNARHDCCAMLFISLLATLCGAKSVVDIADFAEVNADDLSEFVDLPHGAPSHDCFSRLFRLLDPDELSRSFAAFARALREGLGLGPLNGVVAIDGKRLRRGYERGRVHMPPLMVGVFDVETRLSIGTLASADGNEVAATLAVLKSLDLKGCIVTADALHCHPAMAEGVRAAGAHYALKIRGNHKPLLDSAVRAFAEADETGGPRFCETSEKNHGRFESRRASVIAAPADRPNFPGLACLGRIESKRQIGDGAVTTFTHYVALSKRISAEKMLAVIRSHWGIENRLHWPLDVIFNEDDARTRKNHAPQNLSVIRRMAIDILTAHPDERSIARKMKLATWSKEFFFELFIHMR